MIFGTFNFEVHLVGAGAEPNFGGSAAFSEVSGLETQLEIVELREGGYHHGVRRLVGKRSNPELVLKRGMTLDLAFWRWLQACASADMPLPYASGTVRVFRPDRGDDDVVEFRFFNALPTKVRLGELDAKGGTNVAIEELHLSHEGLERRQ